MINWFEFYSNYFEVKPHKVEQNVLCPFHDDKEPSLSINIEKGVWFCHSCKEGGNGIDFYAKRHEVSKEDAKKLLLKRTEPTFSLPSEGDIKRWHEDLLLNTKTLKYLETKRCWNTSIIKKLQLGLEKNRITIPIRGYQKELVNVRKYDYLHKFGKKKMVGIKGKNKPRFFPVGNIKSNILYYMAGEPDTILALRLGLPAITSTSGEGSFNRKEIRKFKNKTVYIIQDNDPAGYIGTRKVAIALMNLDCKIKIIQLPFLEIGEDFTDYCLYLKRNNISFKDNFAQVITETDWTTSKDFEIQEEKEEEKEEDYIEVAFRKSLSGNMIGKKIKTRALCIGTALQPYYVPKKIEIDCDISFGDKCLQCLLAATAGHTKLTIKKNILEMIDIKEQQRNTNLSRSLGIIPACNRYKISIKEWSHVEEIYLTPDIDDKRSDDFNFVVRKGYTCEKDSNIEVNKTFEFSGITLPDPRTQEATYLFEKCEPVASKLDIFNLSQEEIGELRETFSTDDPKEKMLNIARDLQYNVPETIIGREDLFMFCDIIYHSVLSFNLFGTTIHKGWLEGLIIGDERTGKSKTAIKLKKHYRLGDYINLENATIPGLIGGMQKIGNTNIITWGALVVNDRGCAILDELDGVSKDDIGNLSGIRESGIAQRTIVGGTRSAHARVRILGISNPRPEGKTLRHYNYGIQAIPDLIGKSQDIARFDMALIVSSEEVSLEDINLKKPKMVRHVYTSELCRKLVLWTWSRKPKQIHFTHLAEAACRKFAIDMSKKYKSDIPIVKGEVQRLRLAKIAAAIAARTFSTKDGVTLFVEDKHVFVAFDFLNEIYDRTACGYNQYAELYSVNNIDEIKNELETIINGLNSKYKKNFLRRMLEITEIKLDDLMDASGFDNKESAIKLRQKLVNGGYIKRKEFWYIKTKKMVTELKHALQRIRSK